MTREEIIKKGEAQLSFTFNRIERDGVVSSEANIIAWEGIAQLDMLFFILDEEWNGYDVWFEKFHKYIY